MMKLSDIRIETIKDPRLGEWVATSNDYPGYYGTGESDKEAKEDLLEHIKSVR